MNRLFKMVVATTLIGISMSANAIDRQSLKQYAASLKGLKKEELKSALHTLMDKKTVLKYGSGNKGTWWGFWYTDRDPQTKECYNRYSDKKFYFVEHNGAAIAGMNIEHSFPKSWWGGTQNNAYCDLYNLYPSDSKANSDKSNFPMGVVVNVTKPAGEGYDKVGTGYADGQLIKMWEPGNHFKGEFARSYLYMATTYQHLKWVKTGLQSLENNSWPTLREWAYKLYLKWSKQDRVDQQEIDRNNAAAKIQNNRNLFIDYPNLAEYVWGDSVDVAFNPDLSITTASDDARYTGAIVTPTNPSEEPGTPGGGEDDQVTPKESKTFVKATAVPAVNTQFLLVVKVGENLFAGQTVQGKKGYGYLNGSVVTTKKEVVFTSDENLFFTLEQAAGGYYIKDASGRYFYQDGTHKNFNVVNSTDKATIWTVTPNADGTFVITSSDGHVVQYSTQYKSFGAYKPASSGNLSPMLYVYDATAGISTLNVVKSDDKNVYNLQGARMPKDAQLAPGIYIRGGKKFVVR